MRALHNVPEQLRQRNQWVGFIVANGTKTPVIADAPKRKAKSTDPATWRSFDLAIKGLERGDFNAVAYALNGDFIGVDLDDCISGGALSADAGEIVRKVASYSEHSFSGDGVHILLLGALPGGKGFKRGGVEIYGRARFLICTGDRLIDTSKDIRPVEPTTIDWLLARTQPTGGRREGQIASEFSDFSELSDTRVPGPVGVAAVTSMDVAAVIRATRPARPGERNLRILDLARGLKFNAGMQARPFSDLRPIVKQWHTEALPFIATKEFTTTWADFVYAWKHARLPLGAVLETAWQRAIEESQPAIAANYDSEPVRRLISFCAVLGGLTPTGDFFLSSHVAARFLKAHQPQVLRWFKMLEADGNILLVHRGDAHRANRYRWTGGTT